MCHAWERPTADVLEVVWGTKKLGNKLQCNVTNEYLDLKGNETCRSWHLSGVGEELCIGCSSKLHYVHLVNTTLQGKKAVERGPVVTSSSEDMSNAERDNNLGYDPGQPALGGPA